MLRRFSGISTLEDKITGRPLSRTFSGREDLKPVTKPPLVQSQRLASLLGGIVMVAELVPDALWSLI